MTEHGKKGQGGKIEKRQPTPHAPGKGESGGKTIWEDTGRPTTPPAIRDTVKPPIKPPGGR